MEDLADKIRAGDRRALARAITLIESSRGDHRARSQVLLAKLLPNPGRAIRIGISGAPGVGKSTFIEAFGRHLIGAGHKLAVLAVDPSSSRTGGSILADKTRMETLSRERNAFIRPSPAGAALGGVARGTRDAIALVEAAGYDIVIVETVGAGQSETAVDDLVDMFILLLGPAGGDELQGIKRGIVEFADLFVVTKADGGLTRPARRTAAHYTGAANLLQPGKKGWRPKVVLTSAIEAKGIGEVWDQVKEFQVSQTRTGALDKRRESQAVSWMWRDIEGGLMALLRKAPGLKATARGLEKKVAAGELTPAAAAQELLAFFMGSRDREGKS